ncbi:cytotoxic T-lymphocyte protein 4 [Morone saxatilis]|uniref:cytotoxic T-lymphocyte protein 4 n=1 Tax=Morone saxatilis TaxID=34816 RepID=UPI0015E2109C|nr:cytotoxic T-lymphocyte protein 4 [Morone saxatilis]
MKIGSTGTELTRMYLRNGVERSFERKGLREKSPAARIVMGGNCVSELETQSGGAIPVIALQSFRGPSGSCCERHCRMLLTHCMMEWIVLAVLSLCLPVWSAVKVIQPYRVVTTNGTAQVKCFIKPQPSNHQNQLSEDQSMPYPYPGPEELRVTLLKGLHGTQKVCSSVLILKEQREIKEEIEGEFQCSAQESEDAVEVTVSGLKATDTDMYRCEIEVFYPPPYLRLTGNGTLIHVIV